VFSIKQLDFSVAPPAKLRPTNSENVGSQFLSLRQPPPAEILCGAAIGARRPNCGFRRREPFPLIDGPKPLLGFWHDESACSDQCMTNLHRHLLGGPFPSWRWLDPSSERPSNKVGRTTLKGHKCPRPVPKWGMRGSYPTLDFDTRDARCVAPRRGWPSRCPVDLRDLSACAMCCISTADEWSGDMSAPPPTPVVSLQCREPPSGLLRRPKATSAAATLYSITLSARSTRVAGTS
jgi:hypothetical protein